MTTLKEFFNIRPGDAPKGVALKNNLIKRNILAHIATAGDSTIADLSKALNVSIPTVTKLIGELAAAGVVNDLGKVETAGGRRPNLFGLADTAIYFAGATVARDRIDLIITDLKNSIVYSAGEPLQLSDTEECLNRIAEMIGRFIADSGVGAGNIMGIGIGITGRVNPATGVSHRWFADLGLPLRDEFEKRLAMAVHLDNDTRARCYAEYLATDAATARDVLYLNLGRGMAVGIVTDGHLYYGKSGFAGEFGHTPFFDNNVICTCGKRGCLETEVSGIAVENKMKALLDSGVNSSLREGYQLTGSVHIDQIIDAALRDDTLSIELIEEVAEKAGKSIAMLLNIFNPELVVVGGNLSRAGDYLMLPLQAAANKHSVGLVYNDTRFRPAQLGTNAGALGAAMMIRNKIIGLP